MCKNRGWFKREMGTAEIKTKVKRRETMLCFWCHTPKTREGISTSKTKQIWSAMFQWHPKVSDTSNIDKQLCLIKKKIIIIIGFKVWWVKQVPLIKRQHPFCYSSRQRASTTETVLSASKQGVQLWMSQLFSSTCQVTMGEEKKKEKSQDRLGNHHRVV